MRNSYDITIFCVATNRYLEFWEKLVQSFYATGHPSEYRVQWVLYSDRATDLESNYLVGSKDKLFVIPIENEKWPFPTLLKFYYLYSGRDHIFGDYVLHLDADMLFSEGFDLNELLKVLDSQPLAFVNHPGYFRDGPDKSLKFYQKNPHLIASDFKLLVKYGAVGTWETNSNSTAYVPRSSRHKYVCGGVWLGHRRQVLEMSSKLSERIQDDLDRGIIAIYHDESHLNWYFSQGLAAILPPNYCYEPSYKHLGFLKPQIIAVDKNLDNIWKRI